MTVINTNLSALYAQTSSSKANKAMQTSMERLSTGQRINSAADDAAGLAITNRMTAQVRGYAKAISNSNDGISLTQTAEGGLTEVTNSLQRMRELAVQAATGTMSDADRANLQDEVTQLKSQINDVATKTNFNNINLLDGTAGSITLQTGTNAGDTMTIGFASVQTKDIGQGPVASLMSNMGNDATSSTALKAGDLLINGVQVPASQSTSDTLSSVDNSGSAIAKAAAINSVASQTGVTATVGQTVAYGSSMTMTAGATSGTLVINGFSTSTVTTTSDSEVTRVSIVAAINAISDQTGVKATDTGDDSQGIVLTAADGRNISIQNGSGSTLTSATTGLNMDDTGATATVSVGNYSLNTKDGSSFTISTASGGNLAASGLTAGTYQANEAQTVSNARAVATTAAPSTNGMAGVLNGNTLIINDIQIGAAIATDDNASDITAATSTRSASGIAIAAAINKKSSLTGVTATAEPTVIKGDGTFTAGTVSAIYLNGVTISTSFGASTTRDQVINAFNSVSGQTGVTAVDDGAGIDLVAADGRNISIGIGGAGGAAALGLNGATVGTATAASSAMTTYSTVKLSSDKAFSVKSGSEGNKNFDTLGFNAGTFGGTDEGEKIADIDISTQDGATKAIKAIDAAIDTVSKISATAGAYENRLNSVVSNLTTSNDNITASRSQILDTDYATETTSLAKSQIISQAATAMLAQANQSGQTVLSLLK